MDYIDAEAKEEDGGCDCSSDEAWSDVDGLLEDFIVEGELVPFGPKPASPRSEGEGCSTDLIGTSVIRRVEGFYDPSIMPVPPRKITSYVEVTDPFLPIRWWYDQKTLTWHSDWLLTGF